MKLLFYILLCSTLYGCGTINTLSKPDEQITKNLKKNNTYCESIPRVYSGLSYDFCILHSSPSTVYVNWILGFYLIDGIVSAVTDTIALPYTIVQQTDKDSLEIY